MINSVASSIKSFAGRLGETAKGFVVSSQDPHGITNRITTLADNSLQLQKVAERATPSDGPGGEFQATLDRLLAQRKEMQNRSPVVPGVINTPNADPRDPDIVRALPLQTKVQSIDWNQKTEENLSSLIQKLTAFCAILKLREKSGIEEQDNIALLQCVQQATDPEETRSIWEIFTTRYKTEWEQVSWYNYLSAGLFYWFYYQTSLIADTVDTYARAFFNSMRDKLSVKGEKERMDAIQIFLKNTNDFLIQDKGATRTFAEAVAPNGTLEDFRTRTIKRHYNNNLDDLCSTFSERRVNAISPSVPYFRNLQDIPLLGWVFIGIEWVINHFIIQYAMKYSILPSALKTGFNKGIEAAQPHNLPFSLALTKFLNKQIEKTLAKIARGQTPPAPPRIVGTNDKISEVIKNLREVLELEPCQTQKELLAKLLEMRQGKGPLASKIDQYINEGIQDSCYYLFQFFHDSADSGELFYILTDLFLTPLSSQVQTRDALTAQFDAEQSKLKRSSNELFTKIIQVAIDKRFGETNSSDKTVLTHHAFENGKLVVTETCKKLVELAREMKRKIDLAGRGPKQDNNIQGEIASFHQIMDVFANRKEIQDQINALDPKDRNAIWRIITPLYEKAYAIENQIRRLQQLQADYPAHVNVAKKLHVITQLLESIDKQFLQQPRHGKNPYIEDLQNATLEIRRSLSTNDAPVPIKLQKLITEISQLSDSLVREQQAFDALYALRPTDNPETGLVQQLSDYAQGERRKGFEPKACIATINKLLQALPENEQLQQLKALIGNATNAHHNLDRINRLIDDLYSLHENIKKRDSRALSALLEANKKWTTEKRDGYTTLQTKDYADMRKEIGEITVATEQLQTEADRAKLYLPWHFPGAQKWGATSVLAATGYGLAHTFGPVAATSAVLYPLSQNIFGMFSSDRSEDNAACKSAWAKTVATIGTGAAVTYALPAAAPVIAAAGLGLTALRVPQVVHSLGKEQVLPQVLDAFNSARKLIEQSDRIYHAGAARLLGVLSKMEP